MQPTLPQTTGAADMDLPAVQSMDWLFKKERIYLLAQFWQQRATLAEKEVHTLKEQLSATSFTPTTTSSSPIDSPINVSSSATAVTVINNNRNNSVTIPHNQQNGLSSPTSASPPLSDCGSTTGCTIAGIKNNSNNNKYPLINNKMDDGSGIITSMTADMKLEQSPINEQKLLNNNNNTNNNNNIRSITPNDEDTDCASSINKNSKIAISNSCSSMTLIEELAAKDKEIHALVDEITRLRALQDSQIVQIQRLEERLEAKRQHILRLEARLEKQIDLDDVEKDNSNLKSLDMSGPAVAAAAAAVAVATDAKQFQELLLERTKALAAAHCDTIKSNTSAEGNIPATQKTQVLSDMMMDCKSTKSTTVSPALSTQSSANSTGESNNSKMNNKSPSIKTHSGTNTPDRDERIQNLDNLGTFLGEDVVNNWRRNFEFPQISLTSSVTQLLPPAANIGGTITTTTPQLPLQNFQSTARSSNAPSTTALLSHLVNSTFSNSFHTDSTMSNPHPDKAGSHHETSSTASTPNLQDGRINDDHINGGCGLGGNITPLSHSHVKSPQEDNNNALGPLQHMPAGFLPGIPFQFQDRGHFRFAEDLQMPPGSMAGRLGDSLIPKGDPMEAKLQEMLRYNMDKYANQNLDTLHISRRVRELLSVHNIGQRLFAKYILGLSQGTVSELLSKPKPWDKLTEKGRDSYRKMHAWGCDENAVLLLKSLIPKKGLDSGIPQYGRSDDSISDDRIAHILSEASSLMNKPPGHNPVHHHAHHQQQQQHIPQQQQQQEIQQLHQVVHQQQQQAQQQHHQQKSHGQINCRQEDSHSNEDTSSPHYQCTSPIHKDSIQKRIKKFDNDDITHDKVARIYQEELAKLITRTPREAFQSAGVSPAGNQMPDDNIRLALEAYHRELAKLQQSGGAIPSFSNLPGLLALQQQALSGVQDLSVPKEKSTKINGQQNISLNDINDHNTKESNSCDEILRHSSAFSLVRPKQEPGTNLTNISTTNSTSTAPSPLGNSILPPAMTLNDDFSAAASPLQRMASITNSLITQTPVAQHHTTPQRPMKAVLPPITQQQFDMFNNLNTEEIVRRVKEALSQYSISQRLFGESVLGLSQGSVSDLLARPKPWHMLTQKGREPFIRMKMFLEDENAVHKLVASQYKIAPEKLMRTGNYSGSPQIPAGLGNKMVPMQKMMNDLKMQEPQHLMQLQASAMVHVPTSQQHQGMLLTPPGMPPHHAISLSNSNEKKPMMMPISSAQQNNAMRGMHQHMSPTVYEMAALTHDLDTQVITTKIKEALLANNIGQKIFGEAVLGLSQGSVSELLSKPKPWHMLSIKGREPFIRMQLWLSDPNNVERLQALKNERREASKRRRSTGPGTQDNSSDTSSNDTSEFYTNSPGPGSVGSVNAPPNKKQRVLFSEEQKEALRLAFALDPYPNVATIEFLANELGLATRTITNWFHNHRMRLKQQVPHGATNDAIPSRENQTGTPFDPVQFRILLNQRLLELQKERMGLSGVPIPYPAYFAANPNLAALIGRGLLPGNEPDLIALNNAFKEQMSCLDLSMNSLKRDEEYEDVDGEGDSHLSDTESLDGSDSKTENKITPLPTSLQSRISRRKPVAPQWVNPDWQDDNKTLTTTTNNEITTSTTTITTTKNTNTTISNTKLSNNNEHEVIINGVCVMQQQAADYSRKSNEETVRIEPADVNDRFDDDDGGDDDDNENQTDIDDDDGNGETESQISNKLSECGDINETDYNGVDGINDDSNKLRKTKTNCENQSGLEQRCSNNDNQKIDKKDDEETEAAWNY